MIKSEQKEEDFQPFALLIRIERSNKIEMHFQSAYIQIQHNPITKKQLKSIKATHLKNQYDTVWIEDFIYEYVQQGDQFGFTVRNNRHEELGSKAFAIEKLLPYYNTGQIATQIIEIEKDNKKIGDFIVVFSLFQKKDLLAGIFQPNYSVSKSNKQWLWSGYKPDKKQVSCGFFNCFQEYYLQDLPELRVNRVRKEEKQ